MKTDLSDITFILLVRIDSIERLENILLVTNYLMDNFHTHIYIYEADKYCNHILQKTLKKKIRYQFVEDEDYILHKTKYYNQMANKVNTKFIAIWDADIIAEKKYILECVKRLRENKADMGIPYNGVCLNTSIPVRELFIKKKKIKILYKYKERMEILHHRSLVGGAVIMNKEKYIEAGLENELFYGWGDEDFNRFHQFRNRKFIIYRSKNILYHLSHPRNENSIYCNELQVYISKNELNRTYKSSCMELNQSHKNSL
ncbi:MAG: hypothetical protein LIP06_09255 [Tannerellaceae bacterium]|nr:hypothetical protein [Tannerellaceae bacterium]